MAIKDSVYLDPDTGRIKVDLRRNPKSLAFVATDKLTAAYTGGRGASKTVSGSIRFCIKCKPGGRYFIIGPSYTMLQGTIDTFIEVATAFKLWNPDQYWTSKPPRCILKNGAEIFFRSGDEPKFLKGGDKAGAWIDEAQDCDEAVYWMTQPCLRQWGELGWIMATFTPGDPDHWTSKTFIHPANPDDTFFIRATLQENAFAPPGLFDKLWKEWEASPLRRRRELLGECIYLEGAEWLSTYFDDTGFDEWPTPDETSVKLLSCDPSMNEERKAGDYCAFVKGMFHRGIFYLDADMRQEQDTSMVCQTGVELYAEWLPHFFSVEKEAGQHLLISEMLRIADERGIAMGVIPIDTEKIKKEVRIRRITPYVSKRQLRFKNNSPGAKILKDQMMAFPRGKFDDGPDALEMFIRTLLYAQTGRLGAFRTVNYQQA